jgi:hypothetical protein
MRDSQAASLAIAALSDSNSTVVGAAVGSLEELGDSANSAALLAFFDRNPEEGEVLRTVGRLGDPPGSTAVRDRLVAEAFKKSNDIKIRMDAAFGLRAMDREDLARPLFDWDSTLRTYQSLDMLERRLRTLAATRNVVVSGQGDVDTLLRDVVAANHDFARRHGKDGWGRPMHVRFIREGRVRAISNGPDGQPDTSDDVSLAEPSEVYVKRIFSDLF